MTVSENLIVDVMPWDTSEAPEERKKRVEDNIRKRKNTIVHIENCIKEQEKRRDTAELEAIRENAKLCCEALYDLKRRTLEALECDRSLLKDEK